MRKLKNLFKAIWNVSKEGLGVLIVVVPFLALMTGIDWLTEHSEAFTLFLSVVTLGFIVWGVIYLIIDFVKNVIYNYKMLEKRHKRGGDR